MIKFVCPHCGKQHKAKESAAGKGGKCSCGKRIKIPAPAPAKDDLALQPDAPKAAAPAPAADPYAIKEDDEYAIKGEEDSYAIKDEAAGAEDENGEDAVASSSGTWAARQPPPGEPGMRVLTHILIGTAVISLLVLCGYSWHGWKAYQLFKRNKEAIETHNAVSDLGDKDEQKVFDKLLRCIELKPEWAACHFHASVLAVKLGRKDAKERLQTFLATDADPKYQAYANALLGYLALKGKQPDTTEGRLYLQKARKLDDSLAAPALMLAALAYDEGAAKEARAHLAEVEKGLKNLPPEGQALYWRMKTYLAFAERDRDGFLSCQARAKTAKQPESFPRRVVFMAYNLLMASGTIDPKKDEDLLKLASEVLKLVPEGEQRDKVSLAFGTAYYNSENDAEALAHFEKIVKEDAPASDLVLCMANSHARLSAASKEKESDKEKEARQAHADKALALYLRLVEDKAFLQKQGRPFLEMVLGFADKQGNKEVAKKVLDIGLVQFADLASLHRRAGFLALQAQQYSKALEHLQKSLDLDPKQEDLATEIKRYSGAPTFDQFRPAKPGQFTTRPLIHVRVRSGTPMPIDLKSIRAALDDDPIKFALGGNEIFYVPEKELAGGKHSVTVSAKDTLGNSGQQRFAFGVDLNPPTAKLVLPKNGSTAKDLPLVAISLLDEFSTVAPGSVTVILKNETSNPHFTSTTIISRGVWRVDSEPLDVQKGDRLQDPAKIAFKPVKPLGSGFYRIEIKMSDVLDHDGTATLTFSVR